MFCTRRSTRAIAHARLFGCLLAVGCADSTGMDESSRDGGAHEHVTPEGSGRSHDQPSDPHDGDGGEADVDHARGQQTPDAAYHGFGSDLPDAASAHAGHEPNDGVAQRDAAVVATLEPTRDVALDAGLEHAHRDAATPPNATCDSTWSAIQLSILEAKGCTSAACHGSEARSGGLDLASSGAYASLINQPASAATLKPLARVAPGEQTLSLLYLKLAAATEGSSLPAGAGAPMPVGRSPLTPAQLEAVKLWIRAGAPATGVVAGTQQLLDCNQPDAVDPNKSPRPPAPSAEEGFQHAAGPWAVEPHAESEVCFATYYDLTSSAPEWARIPCTIGGVEQTCIAYDRRELSQDAQSHHSAISVYAGAVEPNDPSWGAWRCAGGELAEAPCDPIATSLSAREGGGDCGAAGVCQATPRKMTTCNGFGPPAKETSSLPAGGSQSPLSAARYPEGVYSPLPIKGVLLWNSHGFNLTDKPTTIEQYNTFWYARPERRTHLMQGILSAGESIANADVNIVVPPYQRREYCSLFTLPRHARLLDLSSHVHKRGVLFRTWLPPHETSCPAGGCTADSSPPAHRSTSYSDPAIASFDPPLAFDGADPATRTLKFCSAYDNGKDDPSLLKRKSQLIAGASCAGPLSCAGGPSPGAPCQGDAECGSGTCDACTVTWGVTTEDEMMFLMGSFYVAPASP